MEEETQCIDIGAIRVDKRYETLDKRDLQCVILTVIHRRPDEAG